MSKFWGSMKSGISKGDEEKIMWNIYGSWFLALKIPMGITQFCGISKAGASFFLEFPWVKSQI